MDGSDQQTQDWLDDARAAAATGGSFVQDGQGEEDNAHLLLHSAEAYAQIAQAEQLKRIADLLDARTDAPGLIGVTGSVTTQHV